MIENFQQKLHQALDDFISHEENFLAVDVNERSIRSKLGEYSGKYFTDWNVDCEYNRLGSLGDEN